MLNNTYVLVSAFSGSTTKSAFSFTYNIIKNLYNYSYLDSLGYIPTYQGSPVEIDEAATFYYIIGSVIGFLIFIAIAFFLAWPKLAECFRSTFQKL